MQEALELWGVSLGPKTDALPGPRSPEQTSDM